MRQTALIMGMPITIDVPELQCTAYRALASVSAPTGTNGSRGGAQAGGGEAARPSSTRVAAGDAIERSVGLAFEYFREVDRRFSPYKPESEASRIARGELAPDDASAEMRLVLELCEETKRLTHGYFDAWFSGKFDPSGLVKGWAIREAARLLEREGYTDFCVEAGGDIEVRGRASRERAWRIGLRNPFDPTTIVKVVELEDRGIATSGLYFRGEHIYDPISGTRADKVASVTVIAADVYEADRVATAAFAMGQEGILFLASLPGFDGYLIHPDGMASYTEGFSRYFAE